MKDSDNILSQLPPLFLERMKRLLGAEYPFFEHTYAQDLPVGLRANTLKIPPDQLQRLAPFDLIPLPGISGGFLVEGDEQPGKHPYHAAGLYYLQDPSAMVATQMLDPQPGEKVLDLSAAPGGKSTQLIACLQDRGLLVANEIDARRVWDLVENLERWGAKSSAITNETPTRLADRLPHFFDRILVDAPCSGEGMFRKSEAARQQWSPALVTSCALRQSGILEEAVRMLKPGGRLVYVTCTFAPEEGETVVARFLESHPDFELEELPVLPGFSPGRPDWLPGDSLPAVEHAIRLWPHNWPGGGQFIALLHKKGGEDVHRIPPFRPGKLHQEARGVFDLFREETLVDFSTTDSIHMEGSYLYQIPELLPNLAGLRQIRSGWLLGDVKKGRFEPSHALALGLTKEKVQRCLDFKAPDERLFAYLRGEVLLSTGEDGWILVCVDGYSLGWGKRVKGIIKNHYPRGLRWL